MSHNTFAAANQKYFQIMSTQNGTAKTFYESIVDSQKRMMDMMNESAQKFQSNESINKALENGQEFFKNWLDQQMNFFSNTQNAGTNATEGSAKGMNEFFKNWMENQMNFSRNLYENNQKMMNNWTDSMKNMNPNMNWMGNTNFDWSKMTNNAMTGFNNWMNMLSTLQQQMNNTMSNNDMKEAMNGLSNNAEAFMKFFQMWMPMMKSMQENTFTPEMFKNMMNPSMLKDFMDNMFKFAPESAKSAWENNMKQMQEYMGQNMDSAKNWYDQSRSAMQHMMPANQNQWFEMAHSNYNTLVNSLQNAAAPLAKLSNGPAKEAAESMNTIMDKMAQYNLKNAEMQYHTYVTGMKAMENFAEEVYAEMRKGGEMKGMNSLYNHFLNVLDKNFVALFESDDYSKLQAEVTSLAWSTKKEMEKQMEKMMMNIPVVPRSEMDELYKTVYELNKKVKQLEKKLAGNTEEVENEEVAAKPARKTAAKNA